jgi:thioredoxin reductase (NADPH)
VNVVIRHDDRYRVMSRYLADRVSRTSRIQVWRNCEVSELGGSATLAGAVVRDLRSGNERPLGATAIFVLIGSTPQTTWLPAQIPLDEKGIVRIGSARQAGAGCTRPAVPGSRRSVTYAAAR